MNKKKVKLTYVGGFFKGEFTVGKEYEINNYNIISDSGLVLKSSGDIYSDGCLDGFIALSDDDDCIKAVVI
jgi:hypothetical protein